MLVLGRREGQSTIIRIGQTEITVTLCEIRGDMIRIGFDAPKDVEIVRKELVDGTACDPKPRTGSILRKEPKA